jgi:hypothetical protein
MLCTIIIAVCRQWFANGPPTADQHLPPGNDKMR